jgi:hypothetical protein
MAVYMQVEGGTQKGRISNLSGRCDACGTFGETTIYDARVPPRGVWAYLCEPCFVKFGCQLGEGRGQKYELKDEEE